MERSGRRQQVEIGAVVELEADGTPMTVRIGDHGDGVRVIAGDSPLGRALLGHVAGDVVDVAAPRTTWRARVLSVSS